MPAPAAQLNWDTLTWLPGSLSNSFDIDPGNPGNDVTFTVAGDTAQLQPSLVAPNGATPGITRAFDGGFVPGHNTLELSLNLASNSQSVTLTIDFSVLYAAGVSNVSFNLFDIDFDNISGSTYQDLISSITATSTTGSTIAPTISNVGPNVTLSGSGISQTLTGNLSTIDLGAGSGAANATISFNAPDIRSITFTYSSGAAFPNPTYQHIGIDDIDYFVVPEPGPLAYAAMGLGMLALRIWYRARQMR